MLRRFREHAAKQDWFAVGVDVAIVVVGVFLGTQANNWNQDRIERSEAHEYRAQIIDNLRANEADVAARAHYYRQVRAHAIAALNAVKQPNASRGEPFLIGPGSIHVAHTLEERVPKEQLNEAVELYQRIVKDLCKRESK